MLCSFVSASSLALRNVWGSIVTDNKSFWVLICVGTEVASTNVFLDIKMRFRHGKGLNKREKIKVFPRK